VSGGARVERELADGPAARALFAEYLELVRARLDLADFRPPEHVFATGDVFEAPDGAFLVIYDGCGEPIGCGGLRTLAPGVGEIKRMFVTARARGGGHGRRLLRELERIAAARGHHHVRLLTTEVLREARNLYAAEGYVPIGRVEQPGQPVEIWLEKELGYS
jgi:GNAT superfamily N-acetyltransferase